MPRGASVSPFPASTAELRSDEGTATARIRATFGRRHRLASASDFDRVFREGQRSGDRFFTVLYAANGGTEARLGFAISRQRVRRAVNRNRLRRIVRESFRHTRTSLPPIDIVVLARDAAAAADPAELGASIARHWERLRRAAEAPRTPSPDSRPH